MTDALAQAIAEQNWMLRRATEQVEVAYLKAVRQSIENPTVVLLELEDATAQQIIRTTVREAEAERMIERCRGQDITPIALWRMTADEAADLLPPDHEAAMHGLRTWATCGPPGMFPVVVVGRGAIGLIPFPIPES
jgi:hypothetical protein